MIAPTVAFDDDRFTDPIVDPSKQIDTRLSLDLAHNHIKHLPPDLYRMLSFLKKLVLSDNLFTEIPRIQSDVGQFALIALFVLFAAVGWCLWCWCWWLLLFGGVGVGGVGVTIVVVVVVGVVCVCVCVCVCVRVFSEEGKGRKERLRLQYIRNYTVSLLFVHALPSLSCFPVTAQTFHLIT